MKITKELRSSLLGFEYAWFATSRSEAKDTQLRLTIQKGIIKWNRKSTYYYEVNI